MKHSSLPDSRRAFAIFMVMVLLALMLVLILGVLQSSRTDFSSSQKFRSTLQTEQLATMSTGIIMAQIQKATRQDTPGGQAWTSQPGLMRTYDANGSALQVLKLYSSDSMVESIVDPSRDVDEDWKSKPGLFVDLNQPVPTKDNTSLSYPIVDPAAADPVTGVEGFSISNAPGYNAGNAAAVNNNPAPMPVKWIYVLKDGSVTAPGNHDPGTGIVSFTTEPKPTKSNPIVGRIAFWADDETAKVNINTASEGTYWDVPVCNTQPPGGGFSGSYKPDPKNAIYEFDLGEYQGGNREYQRYAGHPATTNLSAIFGKSLSGMDPILGTAAGRPQLIQTITDIAPKISVYGITGTDNSSQGGTRRAGPPGANSSTVMASETFYKGFRLVPDADRLYDSVDEMMFKVPGPDADPSGTREIQLLAPETDAANVIGRSRFFSTAQSRSPEVNLFNKPRVAIWPLQVSGDQRTYFDKLIAFCASMGVRSGSGSLTPYYFTRSDPTSNTRDWSGRNQAIYRYLQVLTEARVPGFGHSFKSKYDNGEVDQILTEIFDYIRCTNLIDYSDPTAVDTSGPTPRFPAYTATGYKYAIDPVTYTLILNPINQPTAATTRGQVVPIEPPAGTPGAGTRGIGRIATISELALVVIRTGPRKDGQAFVPSGTSLDQDPSKTNLQIALIPQLFSPMAGFSALANNIRIRFKNINISVNGVNAFASKPNYPGPNQTGMYDTGRIPNSQGVDRKTGGYIGYRALLEPHNVEGGPKASNGAPVDSLPAYADVEISGSSIHASGPNAGHNMTIGEAVTNGATMTIGGFVDVEIETPGRPLPGVTPLTLQTFRFVFPTTTVPIPNRVWVPTNPAKAFSPAINNAAIVYTDPVSGVAKRGGRFPPDEKANGVYTYTNKDIFYTSRNQASYNFDVVRSVAPVGIVGTDGVPLQGDMRLIAAMRDVPFTAFDKPLSPPGAGIRPYDDPKAAGVHSLRRGEPATPNGSFYTSGGYGPDSYAGNTTRPAQPKWDVRTSNGSAFGSLLSSHPAQYPIFGQAATLSGNYYSNADWITTPPIPEGVVGVKNSMGEAGDWDNGPGLVFDGPLCNKADEGAERHRHHGMFGTGGDFNKLHLQDSPYLGVTISENYLPQYASFFSPNKMMPSPVMFGSLPTGVKRGLPWQTLLFRPAVDYLPGKAKHPGGASNGTRIPDHVLLDLFWMPVVEPYALSEPMATAGKINMNYQIFPFSHMKRDTGLRAVMSSVKITAINPDHVVSQTYNGSKPGKLISDYKRGGNVAYGPGGGVGAMVRYNIDANETLGQFESLKFIDNKAFISASEICDVPLVPAGVTASGLQDFWAKHTLTGDNSLEKPYCHMYSRLTTKSNTYTVHMWVEVLRPVVPRGAAENDEAWARYDGSNAEQVVSRYRGSAMIERYIDPEDPGFDKFDETYLGPTERDSSGAITKIGSLDGFYKFRVLSTRKFSP